MRRTNMLVLMMGRAPEHAITSFLHFLPKHVVLITTPTFASTYRRRLPHWAKRYDFEPGSRPSLNRLPTTLLRKLPRPWRGS